MPRGAKQQALDVIEALPQDASFEEVMEELCFLSKVRRGLLQIEEGRVVSHEKAKRRLGR
jgi:predicted transcriptional regulator